MTFTFNYNDIHSVTDSIDADTAAIILEPTVFEAPRDNFLHKLKEVCEQNGSLLIFDEMWTGFRIALGGAQEFFGVKADLATFSKAVANGMPIGILAGRKDVMSLFDKEVFFFTTFGGEALSLAACKATINELRSKRVPAYLDALGSKLRDGYNALARDLGIHYTQCSGFGYRSIVVFDATAGNPLEMKSLVQQELFKRGILWSGFHTMSFSHTEDDVLYTLNAWRDVLPILNKAVDEKNVRGYLRGECVEPVFRKTSNFNIKPKVQQ
jgi:glutamate-1-semialdehyde aminotransferase